MPSAEKVRFLSHGKVARSCNLGLRILVLFDGRIRFFFKVGPGSTSSGAKRKKLRVNFIRSKLGRIRVVFQGSDPGKRFFLTTGSGFFLEDRFWVNSNRIRNPGIIPTLAKSIAKGHRQKVALFLPK